MRNDGAGTGMLTSDQALAVLDQSADGVLVTDQQQQDHPIVYANAAFTRLTGYDTAEIIGRNCRFLQNDDRAQPEIAAMRTAIGEATEATVVLRNYRRDGRAFWNEVRLAPLGDANGHIGHYIGFQRDVTDRVEAEIQLRRALSATSAANLSKTRLLKAINHEFRTPIGIIAGFAELLLMADQRGQPEPRQGQYLRDIHAAAFHLLDLVNDARTFMEMTEAGPPLHRAPAKLSAIIADAARRADAKVKAEGAVLTSLRPAVDAVINVDSVLLRQALVTLICELAHRAPRGATIEAAADGGPPASIVLRCTALVLSAGKAEEILEPFGTGNQIYSRGLEGAQISVAVAAAILRLLGGELLVESDATSGTRFAIGLPVLAD